MSVVNVTTGVRPSENTIDPATSIASGEAHVVDEREQHEAGGGDRHAAGDDVRRTEATHDRAA